MLNMREKSPHAQREDTDEKFKDATVNKKTTRLLISVQMNVRIFKKDNNE
jgi:hypothetical protein